MLPLFGMVFVVICVIGSYIALGGKLGVLYQPFELVIIFGSASGAFIIGNTKRIVRLSISRLGTVFKGARYSREDFVENLTMQYQVYRVLKQKGALALESHIEDPDQSAIFRAFPRFHENEQALRYWCDYLRMITLGTDNAHDMESLLDTDLDNIQKDDKASITALLNFADGMPALGIVAAVLGVIKTMGSINEPPEVLGNLIGAALVGTFLGVLLSYGFFGPLASHAKQLLEEENAYLNTLKQGLTAYLNGYAPVICIEFARKSLMPHVRPTFQEMELAIGDLPTLQV